MKRSKRKREERVLEKQKQASKRRAIQNVNKKSNEIEENHVSEIINKELDGQEKSRQKSGRKKGKEQESNEGKQVSAQRRIYENSLNSCANNTTTDDTAKEILVGCYETRLMNNNAVTEQRKTVEEDWKRKYTELKKNCVR